MAATVNLIGVGIPGEAATRLGFTPSTKVGVGTAQTGAATITTNFTLTTTAGGATAFVLPAAIPGSGPILITNPSATTALVFPPSGGTINGGSLNASVSIAQNATRIFFVSASNTWISLIGA